MQTIQRIIRCPVKPKIHFGEIYSKTKIFDHLLGESIVIYLFRLENKTTITERTNGHSFWFHFV